jgi:hypothetical protein
VFTRTLLALMILLYPFKDTPWLVEPHSKLWGRKDVFHQVFRAVKLTKEDFIGLQRDLHHLNSSRNHKNYVTENVLNTKVDFLRSRTATYPLTITGSLVPKVVLHASEAPIPADAMDVDVDIESDQNIKIQENLEGKDLGDEDDQRIEDDEGELDDECDEGEGDGEDDESYIDEDAAVLSRGPSAILPCTIRYMDLTCVNLRHFHRVPKVLLIRDEWDAVVDIFNKRESGLLGRAILTGQPGIGRHRHSP